MPRLMLLLEQHGIAILAAVAGVGLIVWLWFLRAKDRRSVAGKDFENAVLISASGPENPSRPWDGSTGNACGRAKRPRRRCERVLGARTLRTTSRSASIFAVSSESLRSARLTVKKKLPPGTKLRR